MFTKKLDSAAFWIAAILLALLPFHAFLFTWFHSFFWQEGWVIAVQAWKEVLVGILGLLAVLRLSANLLHKEEECAAKPRIAPSFVKRGLGEIWKNKSFWLGLSFITLAVIYALFGDGELAQRVFGLRTATLFLVLFLAIQFFDFGDERIEKLKRVVLAASGLVILFALSQKFILPADFLKYFGYSENVSSWLPGGNLPIYHTVGDSGAIRAQSTFAGPNQLGAYLIVILPLAVAQWWKKIKCIGCKSFMGFVILGGLLTLFLTYSRSAWLAGLCILAAFAVQQWKKNLPKKIKQKLLLGGVLGIIALGAIAIFSPGSREILLRHSSTLAHLERSQQAFELVVRNPLGLGLGQSAGISQRFGEEITPENTYLGVALELGWIGGILFLIFLLTLLFDLRKQNSPLFFSLIGILTIMLFLHPLEDAPTALTLFLLLGIKRN
jgi:hypothetical protein